MPKPFVFVLMPLDESFEDAYKLGIKAAATAAGTYCERIDEQIFEESILDRIYNQITKADLIIADMTGRNPNVFYEVGYAHALGKSVILLTQVADDIPFDLQHYTHIVYGAKISKLKEELENRIRWHVQNPSTVMQPNIEVLEFYMAGTKIVQGARVEIRDISRGRLNKRELIFNLDVHNPTERLISSSGTRFALVFPENFINSGGSGIIRPDGRVLFNLHSVPELLPGAWDTLPFNCYADKEELQSEKGKRYDCELWRYSELGCSKTSFTFMIGCNIKDE
jgi:nucleoside 2-deoxyribosyltransferase